MGTKEKKQGACERRILSSLEFRNNFTKAKGAENRKRGIGEEQGGSRGKPTAEGSAVLVGRTADHSAGLEGGREGWHLMKQGGVDLMAQRCAGHREKSPAGLYVASEGDHDHRML